MSFLIEASSRGHRNIGPGAPSVEGGMNRATDGTPLRIE
jgi:hypothetical protein